MTENNTASPTWLFKNNVPGIRKKSMFKRLKEVECKPTIFISKIDIEFFRSQPFIHMQKYC